MYQTLSIERRDRVATIWMDRPEVFNAFDEQLIADLQAACAELDADDSVRVVVLGGKGKHFSAGADLNWMKRASAFSEEENRADARRFAAMLRVLSGLSKPTIARIQGAALGGGTGLAAACDMAVASHDASFATSEVKFGIIPAVISPMCCARLARARRCATSRAASASAPGVPTRSAWSTRSASAMTSTRRWRC